MHNPGVEVRECKKRNTPVWWVDKDNADFAATPDRILVDKATGEVTALLEIKTARAEDIVKTELTAVMGNASAGVDYANRTVARRSQRKTPRGFSRPWVTMV